MKVYKLRCSNDHDFFIPIKLPMNIIDFVEKLDDMACPLCKSKEININPTQMEVRG